MDERVIRYIKQYKITELEIQEMLELSPMLENTSFDEFVINCLLLEKYGYPKSDLDFLMMMNPDLFVRSAKRLENDLIQLKKVYDDIETVLKYDPTII